MWPPPPGWAVGGDRASRPHGSRPAMPRVDDLDFNETLFYNSTRFNETLFDAVAIAANVYYTPLLIILGVLGNLVSVYVFYTSKLRFQSTSQYLSALAISDTVFLLQLLPPWLNALQLAPLFHQQGWCQLFVYISYVSCCLSAWLVVAFTVERFVAVIFPLRRNVLSTVARARVIIYTLGAGSLLLNLPVLRFATPTKHDCNIDMDYLVQAKYFNLLDTAFSFTIPFGVIVILNTWIVFGVWRLERARRALLRQSRVAQRGRGAGAVQPPRVRVPNAPPRSQTRVTRMLLIVSSGYVLLNVPAYSMRIYAYAYDIDNVQFASWDGLQQVALMFFNTNFGINFLLYCLSGQNFRRALAQAMPWRRMRARREAIERRNPSFRPARCSISDGSTNFTTAHAGSTPDMRRRQRVEVLSRWTFDNSRQRAAALMQAPPPSPPLSLSPPSTPPPPLPPTEELELLALQHRPRPRACTLTRGRALERDQPDSDAVVNDTYI